MVAVPFEMTAEFLLPFLFIFSVVFGVLCLTNVFKNKAVDAVIAFALASFAATNTLIVESVTEFLPMAVAFFIMVFFLAFLFKLFGIKPEKQTEMEGMVVGGGVLVLLLTLGYYVFDIYPVEFPIIGGGDNLIFFVGFLMIISIFWGTLKIGEQPRVTGSPK